MSDAKTLLAQKLEYLHEQFMDGLFDEVEYAERIRLANAAAKPVAWQRYLEALAYTEYMQSRGFYESEAAYQQSRTTAWQQYQDAPIESGSEQN